MHELCEYSKGEGFSEGFDAHLNIEQMNKTSVELFQMYEDHRRNGVLFSTEQEFRGYYALLKLDKHPGYKVRWIEWVLLFSAVLLTSVYIWIRLNLLSYLWTLLRCLVKLEAAQTSCLQEKLQGSHTLWHNLNSWVFSNFDLT